MSNTERFSRDARGGYEGNEEDDDPAEPFRIARESGKYTSEILASAVACETSPGNFCWFMEKFWHIYGANKGLSNRDLLKQRADCSTFLATTSIRRQPDLKRVDLETTAGTPVYQYYTNSIGVAVADVIFDARHGGGKKGEGGMGNMLSEASRKKIEKEQERFQEESDPDAVADILEKAGIRPDIVEALRAKKKKKPSSPGAAPSGGTPPSTPPSSTASGRPARRLGTASATNAALGTGTGEQGPTNQGSAGQGSPDQPPAGGTPGASTVGKSSGAHRALGKSSGSHQALGTKGGAEQATTPKTPATSGTSSNDQSSDAPSGRNPGRPSGRVPAAPAAPTATPPAAPPPRRTPPPLPTRAPQEDPNALLAQAQALTAEVARREAALAARERAVQARELQAGEENSRLEFWSSELALREAEANAADTTLRGREESVGARERASSEQAAEVAFGREELGREKAAFAREKSAAETTLSEARKSAKKQTDLQKDLDRLAGDITRAEERKAKIPGEIKKLEDRLEALRGEIRLANAEKEKLAGKIKELEAEVARLEAQRDALLREQSELETALAPLRTEQADLIARLEALRREENEQKPFTEAARREKERLESEVAALSVRQGELTRSITELEQQIERLKAGEVSRLQGETRLPVSVTVSDTVPVFDFNVWSAPQPLLKERAEKRGSIKSLQARLSRLAETKHDSSDTQAQEDFESLERSRGVLEERIAALDTLIGAALREREQALEAYRIFQHTTQTISALTTQEQDLLVQWEADGQRTTELRLTRQELERAGLKATELEERLAEMSADPLLEVFRAVDRE